jgi:hypothetical protein
MVSHAGVTVSRVEVRESKNGDVSPEVSEKIKTLLGSIKTQQTA